ncbi:MAG: tRNA (adenosine(37)-N6)-threonylcarbamoyltransferase complex dimerization subunit type 1 TsaB [Burkholderiaceae bacterium]
MKLLAFDTSTDVLSIAVACERDGAPRIWQHQGVGGAQASSTLLPLINSLLAQAGLKLAELDAIVFGAGPGSFTGLRTACSVAQGLAFGADLPVLPLDSLLVVAEAARLQSPEPDAEFQVMSLLDARMNQLYVGRYQYRQGLWTGGGEVALIEPEQLQVPPGRTLAGNAFAVYAGRWSQATEAAPWIEALPTAQAMLQLAPQQLAQGLAVRPEQAIPHYVRDKVAKTTLERAAEKMAATLP